MPVDLSGINPQTAVNHPSVVALPYEPLDNNFLAKGGYLNPHSNPEIILLEIVLVSVLPEAITFGLLTSPLVGTVYSTRKKI